MEKTATNKQSVGTAKAKRVKSALDKKKVNKDFRDNFKEIEKSLVGFMNQIQKKIDNHEKFLEDIKKTNEIVEESLCNVLLAIRQNEYLQAWYPAQMGFPEMKVAGRHPATIERGK